MKKKEKFYDIDSVIAQRVEEDVKKLKSCGHTEFEILESWGGGYFPAYITVRCGKCGLAFPYVAQKLMERYELYDKEPFVIWKDNYNRKIYKSNKP